MSFLTQKLIRRKIKLQPDEKKMPWPKKPTRITIQKKCRISDDFGLRSPVIQKPFFSDEK